MSNPIESSNTDPTKTYLEGLEMELQKFWDNSNNKNIEGGITTNNIIRSSRREIKRNDT